jgi:hypothetical protein
LKRAFPKREARHNGHPARNRRNENMTNNPARQALSRAVNRAIAKGSPVIAEKPSLQCLKDRADRASAKFDEACRPHFCDGRWGAYRAIECGNPVPASVSAALDAYHAAVRAFYAARDGERGFLGSRGL